MTQDFLQTRIDQAVERLDAFMTALDFGDAAIRASIGFTVTDPTDSDVDDFTDEHVTLILVNDGSGDETAEVEVLVPDAEALARDFPGIVTVWTQE